MARNPCRLVEPPRLAQAEKTALTLTQAHAVLAATEKRRNAARWSVGLACGLRQGEALGLRWPFLDIDVPDGEPGGDAGLVPAAAPAMDAGLRRPSRMLRATA